MVDAGFEVYGWWLEGIFGGEDEEELEFAALGRHFVNEVSGRMGREDERRKGSQKGRPL